jgi:NADH dehydrogenase FAD-containing subunit
MRHGFGRAMHRRSMTDAVTLRRLTLLGGGHAHLHVLRELARRPIAGVETVVVIPSEQYSGAMVPGFLQGRYEADDLRFDLTGLARRAGARLVHSAVERVDAPRRVVVLPQGDELPFDVCSVDVGCDSAGADTPGVAEHAILLHPVARALELRARLDALVAAGRPVSAIVVGGGAMGVEVALGLQQRLRGSPAGGHVALVEQGTDVLGGFEPTMRRLATDILRAREVSLSLGGRVVSVSATGVTLHNGASLPADLVVWAAGAAAPALIADSGLPRDEHGYLLVDRSMRAVDGSPVWGAGCCISVQGIPSASRGGGYAVREPPALDRSLRAALGRGKPGRYRPQRSSLALLDTAGGWALMRWKGMHRHSRWAGRLKDIIDRRFVRRYRESDEKGRSGS